MKKIVIVSPSLKIGGIERALTVLANYFNEKGHKVLFISCLGGERFYTLNKEIEIKEPKLQNKGGLSKLFFYVTILFFIRKEIKKFKPDVILSFGDWFNPLVLLSLINLKYPIYISDRTSPDYNFNIFTKLGKKILYPLSSGFIAQTPLAANYKIKQFGNKLNIKVIPNAIRNVNTIENIKENIILYVGRFAWEKAPERLIQSFSQLRNLDNWNLHMAGSGPMLAQMKKMVIDLKIEKNVIFHGKVENVDYLLSRASIYVLPSILEGFPNALCEALAAGVPSICFDSIPYQGIVENEINGFVVKNVNELSNKLDYLIENQKVLMQQGKNARTIKNTLSIDNVGENYLNFILGMDKL